MSRGYDVTGPDYLRPNGRIWMSASYAENSNSFNDFSVILHSVILHKGTPHHPKLASKKSRQDTFLSWPQYRHYIKTEDLAEAGFFYTGITDNVTCFQCDGILSDWKICDQPWKEHAKYFPWCYFVKLNKGTDFIKDCLRMPEDHENMNTERLYLQTLDFQVDLAMGSNLVHAILRTGEYPAHIIRYAILRKIQVTGNSIENIDELSEAIQAVLINPMTSNEIIIENEKSDLKAIKNENIYLKEQRLCKVCMEHDIDILFLPCKHLIVCVQCAVNLKTCALCRTKIVGVIKVYMS